MSLRELKFSNQIQEEQIKSVYHKNFNYIVTERFYFQQQWLYAAYNRFKDFDKYLILIHLVHKTFKAYGDFQIKNSFDEFYAYIFVGSKCLQLRGTHQPTEFLGQH